MASNRPRALEFYSQLSATTMPEPVRRAALRVLNAAGPAPAGREGVSAADGRGGRKGPKRLPGTGPLDLLFVKLILLAALFAAGPLAGQEAAAEWRPLFDGKSLAGWKESDFFGAGKVTVEKGVITIGSGALTGITWAASSPPFPTSNYEIRIEAARLKGKRFLRRDHVPRGRLLLHLD